MIDKAEKQKILEELGGIAEDVYDGLVREVIAETHEKVIKLKEALNNNDYDSIAESAHSMKGTFGNFRIHTIYEIAKSMEAAAEEKKAKDGLVSDLKRLEEALAQVEKEF